MRKLGILLLCIVSLFGGCMAPAAAQNVRTYIPAKAPLYLPALREEQLKYWADNPAPYNLAGLVEQESCISLTHSRCWDPKSQLKTAREEGAGFGQITRAYRADGGLRFDSLAELRNKHSAELTGWNWSNVYTRPDLQLRAIILMNRDNYKLLRDIKDPMERLRFTDAAYNGGKGGVDNDRRLCSLRAGCDSQKWFGQVELTCSKSKVPIYGNRNACDINREHVHNVFQLRSDKYKPWFK